jgi:hypothetical protein
MQQSRPPPRGVREDDGMLERVEKFVANLPQEQLALYFSGFFVLFAWSGIILVRPFLRFWFRRQPNTNELVSYASSGFSLFYGLLLGLLSVAAYQSTRDVNDYASREALAISTIYRSAEAYPEPIRSEVQFLLRDYTLYVINKDWPAHREGTIPMGGEHRLQVLRQKFLAFEPQNKTQDIFHNEVLRYFNVLTGYRQQRLSGVSTSIPGVLWYVVAIGAFFNILFLWMLDIRFMPLLLLSGIVSFFLGVMIFLIYSLDHPLQGAVNVSPDAYQAVYDLVMKWDETP